MSPNRLSCLSIDVTQSPCRWHRLLRSWEESNPGRTPGISTSRVARTTDVEIAHGRRDRRAARASGCTCHRWPAWVMTPQQLIGSLLDLSLSSETDRHYQGCCRTCSTLEQTSKGRMRDASAHWVMTVLRHW